MANKDASRPELSLIYNYIACEKQEKTELDKKRHLPVSGRKLQRQDILYRGQRGKRKFNLTCPFIRICQKFLSVMEYG
jgi:hypothetical protein